MTYFIINVIGMNVLNRAFGRPISEYLRKKGPLVSLLYDQFRSEKHPNVLEYICLVVDSSRSFPSSMPFLCRMKEI